MQPPLPRSTALPQTPRLPPVIRQLCPSPVAQVSYHAVPKYNKKSNNNNESAQQRSCILSVAQLAKPTNQLVVLYSMQRRRWRWHGVEISP